MLLISLKNKLPNHSQINVYALNGNNVERSDLFTRSDYVLSLLRRL